MLSNTLSRGLYGRPRRRLIDNIRTQRQPCHICGYPIDYQLDGIRHRWAYTLDELIPRSHGGDPLDPANCAPAHRACNSTRNNRPITAALRLRCRRAYEAAHRLRYRPW